jgi:hypothetical protein
VLGIEVDDRLREEFDGRLIPVALVDDANKSPWPSVSDKALFSSSSISNI